MRFRELQDKEVINACDCCKLGYVVDLVIDECKGDIEAIIIPKGGKFLRAIRRWGRSILFLLNVSKELARILF